MRKLEWTKNAVNNYEGRIAHILMFAICYHPERGWFISPKKLPGLNKTIPVATPEEGRTRAERLYREWVGLIQNNNQSYKQAYKLQEKISSRQYQ